MTELILQMKEMLLEYNPSSPALRHAFEEKWPRHRARAFAAVGTQ